MEGGDFGGEFFVLGCEFEELFFGRAGLLDVIGEEVVVESPRKLVDRVVIDFKIKMLQDIQEI